MGEPPASAMPGVTTRRGLMKRNAIYGLSGAKLKERRRLLAETMGRDVPQKYVADRAGLLVQNYARLEQADRSNPTLDIAVRVARAMLCRVEDLIEE